MQHALHVPRQLYITIAAKAPVHLKAGVFFFRVGIMGKWVIIGAVIAIVAIMAINAVAAPRASTSTLAALDAERIEQEQNNTEFKKRLGDVLIFVAYTVTIVGASSAVIVLGTRAYREIIKQRNENRRQRDGFFALVPHDVSVYDPGTGRKTKTKTYLNPNTMVGSAATLRHDGKWDESEGGAGWANQLITSRDALGVARVQAGTPGDLAVIGQTANIGTPRNLTIKNQPAPANWFKDPKAPVYRDDQRQIANPQENAPQIDMLSFRQAWEESTPDQWVIGFSTDPKTPGYRSVFEPMVDANIAIIGGTGMGKTYCTGYEIIALAIRYGYKVAIIDGKGGADLSVFKRHAEYQRSSGQEFPAQLKALHDEYVRRNQMLGQYEAADIDVLKAEQGIDLPRIFVVVEEFGRIWEHIPSDKGVEVLHQLNDLMAMSRAAGFHWGFIDQRPSVWPEQMRQNVHHKVVYRSDATQSNSVQTYNCNALDRGEFKNYTTRYKAFHARDEVKAMLPGMRAVAYQQLLPAPALPMLANNQQPTDQPVHRMSRPNYNINEPRRHDELLARWFAEDTSRWQDDRTDDDLNGDGTRPVARLMVQYDLENYGILRPVGDFVGIANERLQEMRKARREAQGAQT
jgi:hypothetical protein